MNEDLEPGERTAPPAVFQLALQRSQPTRHSRLASNSYTLQASCLILGSIAIALVARVLAHVPRIYKRTMSSLEVDNGNWQLDVRTDPRIGNLSLYYSLVAVGSLRQYLWYKLLTM